MLKIEYLPVADLVPYSGNAKEHTPRQVEQIAQSIMDFGFNDPIAVDESNVLIEGHGRLLAAQNLGMDTVPVIRLEGLTEEQKRAYTLVHNQLTMLTDFDFDELQNALDSIIEIDMAQYDFDAMRRELDEAAAAAVEAAEPFSMDDIVPVQGYDEEKDERPYFESAFTFPKEYKRQIASCLSKHKAEITRQIIEDAVKGG